MSVAVFFFFFFICLVCVLNIFLLLLFFFVSATEVVGAEDDNKPDVLSEGVRASSSFMCGAFSRKHWWFFVEMKSTRTAWCFIFLLLLFFWSLAPHFLYLVFFRYIFCHFFSLFKKGPTWCVVCLFQSGILRRQAEGKFFCLRLFWVYLVSEQ